MNIYTQNNVMTVSDMRLRPDELLKRAQEEPMYIFHRSTPKAIIISVEEYVRLKDELEDYELGLKAAEYEKQDFSKIDWISHEKIRDKLKKRKQSESII